MKIASIDIGSNTVLLLIAETDDQNITKTVLNRYRMPRISKGLTKERNISDSKIEELFTVLAEYKSLTVQYKCTKVLVTATAGFRKAANSEEISKMIKTRFGFTVETINGKTEALYSFLGASSDIAKNQNRLVIDIGGGSTELIYGNVNEIIYSHSFPFGAVNTTEKFVTGYPVNENEINNIKDFLRESLEEIVNRISQEPRTIAVAGTPTTLSSMNQNLKTYNEDLVENSVLNSDQINNLISKMIPLSPEEILKKYGEIVSGRNDVILTGTLILKSVMDQLKINSVKCSGKGIRYGAIVNYLQRK